MRVFTLFGLVFNTVFFIFVALLLFGFAANFITPLYIFNLLVEAQGSFQTRAIITLIGTLILLISASFAQSVIGKMQREKNIAFSTTTGKIIITLAALEDLIKRLALQLPEVKNLRPNVVVRKKDIVVNLRIDLRSENNIPELTEKLQELVKNKIRDMLRGIDEPILVNIHVAKIVLTEDKKKKEPEATESPAIPFYGYGR